MTLQCLKTYLLKCVIIYLKVKFIYGKYHEIYTKEFNINEDEWRKIYTLAFSLTKNRQIIEFHYKICHGYLALKSFLYKIGVSKNNKCTICFEESETTEHLFFNCKIHNFWKNLGIFYAGELNDNTFTNIQDDKKTIMFGCVRNDNIMCLKNKIILFAKYYIYICVGVNRQSCYLKNLFHL